MTTDAYLVVNPIVRIEESKLLSEEQIQSMLDGSWDDCMSVLKVSEYRKYLQYSDFNLNYAKYILDYQISMIDKLYQVAPDKNVLKLYLLRFTYHNTKMIMKALLTQSEYEPYIVEDRLYKAKDIEDAILHQDSDIIHPCLMDAIREVDIQLQQQYRTLGVDIIMDRYYMKDMYRVAIEINDEDILHYIRSFIDCNNLSICLRTIQQKKELHYISSLLSEHGYLSIKDMIQACSSYEELLEFMKSTPYSNFIHDNESNDLALFDVRADTYLLNILEKSKYIAFGPLPLMNLLEMHERQRKNLQLLLSSKQSGIDHDVVKERLR